MLLREVLKMTDNVNFVAEYLSCVSACIPSTGYANAVAVNTNDMGVGLSGLK